MAYWLMKTEPEEFSWDDQVKRGAKGEPWSGVRNHHRQAQPDAHEKGRARVSSIIPATGKEIVGIVEVIREHYPDPTAKPGEPWVAVDVKAIAPFSKPVTLVEAKTEPKLERYGAGQQHPPVGAAGDRRRMEARLQDGRSEVGLEHDPEKACPRT